MFGGMKMSPAAQANLSENMTLGAVCGLSLSTPLLFAATGVPAAAAIIVGGTVVGAAVACFGYMVSCVLTPGISGVTLGINGITCRPPQKNILDRKVSQKEKDIRLEIEAERKFDSEQQREMFILGKQNKSHQEEVTKLKREHDMHAARLTKQLARAKEEATANLEISNDQKELIHQLQTEKTQITQENKELTQRLQTLDQQKHDQDMHTARLNKQLMTAKEEATANLQAGNTQKERADALQADKAQILKEKEALALELQQLKDAKAKQQQELDDLSEMTGTLLSQLEQARVVGQLPSRGDMLKLFLATARGEKTRQKKWNEVLLKAGNGSALQTT